MRNILDVSEKEQLVSMETTLRLFWKVSFELCHFQVASYKKSEMLNFSKLVFNKCVNV